MLLGKICLQYVPAAGFLTYTFLYHLTSIESMEGGQLNLRYH